MKKTTKQPPKTPVKKPIVFGKKIGKVLIDLKEINQSSHY
jgi:hypothetical protein